MARERVPAEPQARANQHDGRAGGRAGDGASEQAEAAPATPRTTANDLPFLESERQRSSTAERSGLDQQDLDSAPPSIPSAASLSADSLHSNEVLSEPPARQVNSVLPGHVIAGRYLVRSVLGEGGMGIVYCCRDQATDEDVALKRVILPEGQLAEEYLMWFYKEARALAALDHPSIVRARDFGQLADGSPYLAMDLAAGISLHDLAQARMNFSLIWSIVDQILSALAHAHARGIIHGDLKPSNVLVERIEGEPPVVRVLDFGLAWLRQDPHDERLDGEKAMEFLPHAGAGTPGYMAPEQIQHEMHNVSGGTDLYALGCILYKALSGRSAFSGNSKELLRVHAFEPAPELKPVVAVPEGVASFVMRLLAKRPWERFEYAAEARAVWSEWRPSGDPEGFEFPKLPRARQIKLAPFDETEIDRSKPLREAPELAAVAERAPGLLSIRPSPLVGQHVVADLA